MASPDADAPLRQPSFGIPAAGAPTREAAAARLLFMLYSDPAYAAAVAELRAMDGLCDADWPEVDEDGVGFGRAQFMQQDGGGALLDGQLLSSDIEDMKKHVRRAQRLQHPSCSRGDGYAESRVYERRRDAEVESAVRRTVELGAGARRELGKRRIALSRISDSLLRLSGRIREQLSPQHIRCTPFDHAHIAFFAAIREALDLPDRDLAVRLALGSPVAGDLPASAAWDDAFVPRPLGLDFDDLPHEQWNAWLAADVAARAVTPSGLESATAVWAKTVAELDKGLCDGPWEASDLDAMYGLGCWRAMRRFGVEQNGDVRVCDDAAESLHNDSSNQRDKLRCQQADFPARAADRFAVHLGRGTRGWSLLHGTDDVDSAYRRVLTATPGYTVVAVWDPTVGRVRYITLPGFNFGLVSAVLFFNAVPSCIASAARRLLSLVTDHYFDDFDTVVTPEVGTAGQAALGTLCQLLGFPLSVRKHKPAAAVRKFCGVVTDFANLASRGEVSIYIDAGRRDKLVAACTAGMEALPPSLASRLHGKLLFTLLWSFGRIGRAALQPISNRASSKRLWDSGVTPAIRRALSFLKDVVEQLPPRVLSLDLPLRPPVLVWSDARFEADSDEPAGGGFVIVVPAEGAEPRRVLYAFEDTDAAVLGRFIQGKTQYIGQLELLYAVAPYYSAPEVFAGRQVIHFIDNTSACAALVKGYARAVDSGLIVNAFHAFNVGLQADVFFEYVRSKANIADLPSRGDVVELCELLHELGMWPETIECTLPPFEAWDAPAREWMRPAQRGGEAAGKRSAPRARGARAGKVARSNGDERRR